MYANCGLHLTTVGKLTDCSSLDLLFRSYYYYYYYNREMAIITSIHSYERGNNNNRGGGGGDYYMKWRVFGCILIVICVVKYTNSSGRPRSSV